MADIQKCFKNGYLWKVDKSNALLSCIYGIADTTVNEVSTLKIPEADAFINSLKFNSNGNFLSDNHQWEKAHPTIQKTPQTNLC